MNFTSFDPNKSFLNFEENPERSWLILTIMFGVMTSLTPIVTSILIELLPTGLQSGMYISGVLFGIMCLIGFIVSFVQWGNS